MSRPNHIMDVMRKLHGGCWYSFGGKEPVYENIVLDPVIWDNAINDTVPNPYEIPTKEFLGSELARIQAEWDNDYERLRKAEYPSTDDLIVALWENVIEERAASVIELEAKRQDVKTKYPKS